MDAVFQLEQIQQFLTDFYLVTGHQIGIFDARGNAVMRYPTQLPNFCRLVQSTELGRQRCASCDLNGFRQAQKSGAICMYRCHAGLLEICAPIQDNGQTLSYLMFGHLLLKRNLEAQWEVTRAKCLPFLKDAAALRTAFDQIQTAAPEYIQALSNILTACVGYIQQKQLIRPLRISLWEQLQAYLTQHIAEKIVIEELALAFSVSVSTLSRHVLQNTGLTVGKWILRERMELACRYLRETTLPISRIAEKSGIPDYNYFSRLFSREIGVSPRKYRQNLRAAEQR